MHLNRPEPHHDHITHQAAVRGRESSADDRTENVQVCVHHNRHVDIYVYRLVPDRDGASVTSGKTYRASLTPSSSV